MTHRSLRGSTSPYYLPANVTALIMKVPKVIDIAVNRDGGKKDAAVADAAAAAGAMTTKKESSDAVDSYNSSSPKLEEQMTMETLPPNWRDALNESSVMANAIRHHLEPGVHTTMDRDIGLWVALEEDIMSLGSDDSNDLDYGADDDLDNDGAGDGDDDDDDEDESVSSGGSSELSDGSYIVDEPNPFGKVLGSKGRGSIVDDWTDDEEASDVSNWSDDNGGKKKKKKKKKKQSKANSRSGSNKKVLVSSRPGTQKQLSAFGIKMTITNKTGGDGGNSSDSKKRKSTATTTAATTAKKKRGKKKSPSTAAPNGKVRSETNKKPYAIGSSIVLRNLTANDLVGLNGKRAVVRSTISDDGKQEIEVEGQEGLIPMSLENMRGVCPLFGRAMT